MVIAAAPTGNGADGVALALNFVATAAANSSGHASAELEVVIGGVDDGVDVHGGEVALHEDDAGVERRGGGFGFCGGVGFCGSFFGSGCHFLVGSVVDFAGSEDLAESDFG